MISGLLKIWIAEGKIVKIYVVEGQLGIENSVQLAIENNIQASFSTQTSIGKLAKQHESCIYCFFNTWATNYSFLNDAWSSCSAPIWRQLEGSHHYIGTINWKVSHGCMVLTSTPCLHRQWYEQLHSVILSTIISLVFICLYAACSSTRSLRSILPPSSAGLAPK